MSLLPLVLNHFYICFYYLIHHTSILHILPTVVAPPCDNTWYLALWIPLSPHYLFITPDFVYNVSFYGEIIHPLHHCIILTSSIYFNNMQTH